MYVRRRVGVSVSSSALCAARARRGGDAEDVLRRRVVVAVGRRTEVRGAAARQSGTSVVSALPDTPPLDECRKLLRVPVSGPALRRRSVDADRDQALPEAGDESRLERRRAAVTVC